MINFILCGEKLQFDEEHLSVDEARLLKQHAGLSIRAFLGGFKDYDVDAVAALVWLAKRRAGDPVPWEAVQFDLISDLEIIPDEADDAGPPPPGETSTSTTPPSTPSTPTATGRTGSGASRSTSATPPQK